METLFARIAAKESAIAIVGLGYVGLPLACLLADRYRVVGFDINDVRVRELRNGEDRTGEVDDRGKLMQPDLTFSSDPSAISDASVIIVAVPTPVDEFNVPDLRPVIAASQTVGRHMKRGAIVVFESTVYPGLTETICARHLAAASGLVLNESFFLGYSPERVVPGDKERTIDKITKIVSGSTPEVLEVLARLYGSVVRAGVHKAATIKVAEAAKVVENTQRDLNIALVNELSLLFDKLGIDTLDVLAAAGTKWNFLPFRPGLVGGHCIGVDPYYLTHLADSIGFHTQVISSGRRINDTMGAAVAQKAVCLILNANEPPRGRLNIAVMGITFKENVPDIRNSKVNSLVVALESYGANVHVFDPLAHSAEVEEEYNRKLVRWEEIPECDAVVLAVTHKIFQDQYPLSRILEKCNTNKIVLDLKGSISRGVAGEHGVTLWRL